MSGNSLRIGRKKEGDWRGRVGDACYKKSLFVHCCGHWCPQIPDWLSCDELLIGMYPGVRDKHQEMCSTGISFGKSKLHQSCGNFTSKT